MVPLWISGSFCCCSQFGFRALNLLMCYNSNLYASFPILLLLFLYYKLCISINKIMLFSQEHIFMMVWGQQNVPHTQTLILPSHCSSCMLEANPVGLCINRNSSFTKCSASCCFLWNENMTYSRDTKLPRRILAIK